MDAGRDPGGPDAVEGVHGGDHPEGRSGGHPTHPRDGDLALGHGREEGVERVLGRAVELLYVEEPTRPHGFEERAVHEVVRAVVLTEHPRRVVVADELGRSEVGVPLDEHQGNAPLLGDGTQQGALGGARGTLEHQIPTGRHRRQDQLELSPATHDPVGDPPADLGEAVDVRPGRGPVGTGSPPPRATLELSCRHRLARGARGPSPRAHAGGCGGAGAGEGEGRAGLRPVR